MEKDLEWYRNHKRADGTVYPVLHSAPRFRAGQSEMKAVVKSIRFYDGSDKLHLAGFRVDYINEVIAFDR